MARELNFIERRVIAEDLVYGGALQLDELRWQDWLAQAAESFRYRIGAYSPEIRKEMLWLEHDRAGLAALFELISKHHVDHGTWFRQVTVQQVTQPEPEVLQVVSQFVIHRTAVDVGDTHVEAGSTRLYAVGRYHDRLVLDAGRWLLGERLARLDTRQLGLGSHMIV